MERSDGRALVALADAAMFRLDLAARLTLRDLDQAQDAVQESITSSRLASTGSDVYGRRSLMSRA